MPILRPDTHFNLVHVGKCGGGTIFAELQKKNYQFERYHMKRPIAHPESRYIFIVRDPLTRFVSAFNWRKRLYLSGMLPGNKHKSPAQEIRGRAEKEFLSLFKNVNDLAESLAAERRQGIYATSLLMNLIGHVSHGFCWYLDTLLDDIRPDQISGVICKETLSSDFQNLFGFQPILTLNRHQTTDETFLSDESRASLAREFHSEFILLEKLSSITSRAGIPMSTRYDPASGAIADITLV